MSNKSNTEFLTELMEYSPSGAMMQLVVMQALISYCDKLISEEDLFLKMMEKNPMISGPAWMAAVKELHAKLEERMPSPKKASKSGAELRKAIRDVYPDKGN